MDEVHDHLAVLRELHVDADLSEKGILKHRIAYVDAITRRLLGPRKDALSLHLSLPTGIISLPKDHEGERVMRVREELLSTLESEGRISSLELSQREFKNKNIPPSLVGWADFNTEPYELDQYLREYRSSLEGELNRRVTLRNIVLKDKVITFDEVTSVISVGERTCRLPLGRNEFYIASMAIGGAAIGEPVEAMDIYERMTGTPFDQVPSTQDALKVVSSAMHALNERVRINIKTSDDLLTWKNKAISRNY